MSFWNKNERKYKNMNRKWKRVLMYYQVYHNKINEKRHKEGGGDR
jgi:hypothetical protein